MKFNGITLVTSDVKRLIDFYEQVLRSKGEIVREGKFASIAVSGVELGFWIESEMEDLAVGSTRHSGRGACLIEFESSEFERDYARLKELGVNIVKEPTTQPWGRNSFWFRDPDGNVVNFFVTAQKK